MIAAEDPGVSTNLISMADEPVKWTVLLVWTLETLTLLALETLAAISLIMSSGSSLISVALTRRSIALRSAGRPERVRSRSGPAARRRRRRAGSRHAARAVSREGLRRHHLGQGRVMMSESTATMSAKQYRGAKRAGAPVACAAVLSGARQHHRAR